MMGLGVIILTDSSQQANLLNFHLVGSIHLKQSLFLEVEVNF